VNGTFALTLLKRGRIHVEQVLIFHAAPTDGGDDADSVTIEVNRASRSVGAKQVGCA